MPTLHDLKVWPEYYQALAHGLKPFEVRKNDRNFQVDDLLVLCEWDPADEAYTGRECLAVVTYVMPGGRWGLDEDHVVLGLTVWHPLFRAPERPGPYLVAYTNGRVYQQDTVSRVGSQQIHPQVWAYAPRPALGGWDLMTYDKPTLRAQNPTTWYTLGGQPYTYPAPSDCDLMSYAQLIIHTEWINTWKRKSPDAMKPITDHKQEETQPHA